MKELTRGLVVVTALFATSQACTRDQGSGPAPGSATAPDARTAAPVAAPPAPPAWTFASWKASLAKATPEETAKAAQQVKEMREGIKRFSPVLGSPALSTYLDLESAALASAQSAATLDKVDARALCAWWRALVATGTAINYESLELAPPDAGDDRSPAAKPRAAARKARTSFSRHLADRARDLGGAVPHLGCAAEPALAARALELRADADLVARAARSGSAPGQGRAVLLDDATVPKAAVSYWIEDLPDGTQKARGSRALKESLDATFKTKSAAAFIKASEVANTAGAVVEESSRIIEGLDASHDALAKGPAAAAALARVLAHLDAQLVAAVVGLHPAPKDAAALQKLAASSSRAGGRLASGKRAVASYEELRSSAIAIAAMTGEDERSKATHALAAKIDERETLVALGAFVSQALTAFDGGTVRSP